MIAQGRVFAAGIAAVCLAATLAHAGAGTEPTVPVVAGQQVEARPGDFDMMFERRLVRVLVPPSRTLYFNDKGEERGITAELVRDFELYLNQKYKKKLKRRPITVLIIPTPRDRLISDVVAGYGDIAAGNLTATPGRRELVDFIAPPEQKSVSEVVVTRKSDGPLSSTDGLAGRTVHVRASSSYYESLRLVSEMLVRTGKEPIRIITVPEVLEDEDLMEMVDAGVLSTIVVNDWKAAMWAQILPNIIVNADAAVRSGGQVGWAHRKNSPLLEAELNGFYYKFEKQRGTIPYRFAQYNKQVKRLQDPTGRNDWKRFQETVALFKQYGDQYGFDPLMLAAQGYQESQLDQKKRSPVGAIGIMQLMPDTGAAMKVGDVTVTEPNIHAGAKYMNTIITQYFGDAHFDEFNRALFAFAAYNAGPNRIERLRGLAAERGLDPDVWFDNVEVVVSEQVGSETTTYVRNIVKYYISYKLTMQMQDEQEKVREEFPAQAH